jgi:phage gp37-like protein
MENQEALKGLVTQNEKMRAIGLRVITNDLGGFCLDVVDSESGEPLSNWNKLVIEQELMEVPKVIVTFVGAKTPVVFGHEPGRYVPVSCG